MSKCVMCGVDFKPTPGHERTQKYCSQNCYRSAMNASKRARDSERSSVGKPAICKICGREYIKRYSMNIYCSTECKEIGAENNKQKYNKILAETHAERDRSRKIRGSKEHVRECVVCGKAFTTWLPQKKTCSDECKEVHKKNRDKGRVRNSKKTPEKQHCQWIRRRYGSEENYQKWLAEQEALKQKREQERLERKEAYENQLEEWRIAREARKEANHRKDFCIVCGKEYATYNPAQKTCSKECSKKLAHAHKHKRIPKSQLVDKDITLEALYRRDSGVCYLCGGPCDWNDKTDTTVRDNYPSIDHVVPISKGGLHAWGNIKLAHFGCNRKKADTLLPEAM